MTTDKEKGCWYWGTDPREGDVWFPFYYREDGVILIDGVEQDAEPTFNALITVKAEMPKAI